MRRRRKHHIQAYIEKVPIALFTFDLLLIKNRNLLGVPLSERRRLLENCIKPSRLIRLSNYTVSSDIAGVERYFRQALGYGAEGVVIKSAAAPYHAGKRGWPRIKFKREYQKPSWSALSAAKATGREAMDRCFLLPSILLRTDIIP